MELNKKIETLYQKNNIKTLSPETNKSKNKIRRQVLMGPTKELTLCQEREEKFKKEKVMPYTRNDVVYQI
jgi:hypothetical protein